MRTPRLYGREVTSDAPSSGQTDLRTPHAIERRLAQQMTYCLRELGVLQTTGKRGNAIVHRRTETVIPSDGFAARGRDEGSADGLPTGFLRA